MQIDIDADEKLSYNKKHKQYSILIVKRWNDR